MIQPANSKVDSLQSAKELIPPTDSPTSLKINSCPAAQQRSSATTQQAQNRQNLLKDLSHAKIKKAIN